MQMSLSKAVAGAARDPWHLGPGELAPGPVAQGRPTWQVTRWPVSRSEYDRLVQAARQPDAMSLTASAAVADTGTSVAAVPTVNDNLDGIPRTALEPPDPALAVGLDDVMTAVNAQFAVTAKGSTAPLAPVPFSAMFGHVLPHDASFMFDPKLAYDHFAKRWIAIVGAKRETPPGSWIMLAVSQTGDPRGLWYTWALDASLDGTTPTPHALTVWTLKDPLAAWKTPPGSPVFAPVSVACQSYDLPPSAEQPGAGPRIATDDTRLLDAVYHGDGPTKGLWTTHTSKFTWPGDGEARSVVQWYQLDVAASKAVQQGRYGAPGIYQFFPAIQPIASGDTFVVFGRSSATDFAHLRVAGRQAADPPNALSNSVVIQPGASVYPNTRWGDYFSVAIDPDDDGSAWMCGEYAGPAGAWATRICSVFF